MSGNNLAQIYCVAGALLGLWGYMRFPAIAPKKISTAMLVLLATVAALAPASKILGWSIAEAGKPGALLALFGVVLPALTALFWATACVFRAFCGLLGPGVR
jgi:hypothetical protein